MEKPSQNKLSRLSKDVMQPLAIDVLIDNSTTDFELYLEFGNELTLYAGKTYRWQRAEIERLRSQGHRYFFYHNSDQAKVEVYRRINQSVVVDVKSEPSARIVNLTDAAAELTRILYEYPLAPASIAKGEDIAKAMVDCLREDVSSIKALGHLARHDHYTYYHSARVAAYALAIALHLSARDEQALQDLALGCLFHDVGKSRIDLKILNKTGALTNEEWQLMRKHPVFGGEMVMDSLLSVVPRSVIMHHHERLDGSGYPYNLTGHELLEEVKIAAFADVFDALTTSRPYQPGRSRYEALDLIRHKLLKVVHQDSFEAMVELLSDEPKVRKSS